MKGTITMELLKPVEKKIAISTENVQSVSEYFKTRPGLYVSDGFKEKVLANLGPVSGIEFKLESWELLQDSVDDQIEKALEDMHVFKNMGDLCAILAELIEKQPEGKEGVLLANGYANIWYTPSCVVRVFWYSVSREWSVGAWQRDGGRAWYAGRRVFSPQLTLDI